MKCMREAVTNCYLACVLITHYSLLHIIYYHTMTLPLCHSLLTLSALSCLSLSLSLFPSLLVSVILSKAQSDKWDGTKSLFRVRVTLSHCFKNVTTTCFLTTRELLFNFGISEFVCIRITLLHPPIYFS
jgi:hypothetical protein